MADFVPTRASQIKSNTVNNYMSTNCETPRRKSKPMDDSGSREKLQKVNSIVSKTKNTPADLKKQQEKEMKKVRYDIIKFGMTGFEKAKAKKAKVELAISLGAVPPKNRRMNYKKLKARRDTEEKKKKEEQEHTSGFTSSLLKPKARKKIHKKDSGILGVYGKVPKGTLPKQT